ncbi:MAG: FkbM family methyltransferase [Pirellulaceae bacterium]
MTKKRNEYRLSNGLEVYCDSKANLEILDRELFRQNSYFQYGITLDDGDCVFDVGANCGMFVLYLNQLLRQAKVHAFEPIPATFQLLEKNAARHNRLDLDLHPYGLSREAGEATFRHFPGVSVASTMYPQDSRQFRRDSRLFILQEVRAMPGLLGWAARCTPGFFWTPVLEIVRRWYQRSVCVTCRLATLSQIIRDCEVTRIDLLKVDAEGAEHDVLAGLAAEHWPLIRQAVVEVHHGQSDAEEISKLFASLGFECTAERLSAEVDHLWMVFARRPADWRAPSKLDMLDKGTNGDRPRLFGIRFAPS